VKYVPAGVSDGGAAFASAWTRYDNNEPQTGSVNSAASTQAYQAFNVPKTTVFTGTLTSGSTSVTSVSSTTGLAVGQQVIGTGITEGTTLAAIGSGTITLSMNATASGATLLTAFQAQYTEMMISEPPYWTGTSISIDFFSSATTGDVTWEVQATCQLANTALTSSYSPSFPAATAVTTPVSSTAYGQVTTATVSNIAAPGQGNCPSSPTTPTKVIYRVYLSPTTTASALSENYLGGTLSSTRSQ
jgi:hypothetical protein